MPRGDVLEPAAWGARVVAQIIDFLISALVFGALFGAAAILDAAGAPVALFVPFSAGGVLAAFLVAPVTMARTNGQTIGKRMMRLRVVRTGGERVSLGWSLVRELLVKQLLSLLLVLDQLWPLWDPESRALHDFPMGSRVIRAQAGSGSA